MQLIKDINLLTKKEFLSIFGNIFEKSDWIAICTFELKPFKDEKLLAKMYPSETFTYNTTAAGGNASLMMLEENK